jgi:anti-sigma factor RsiW
MKNWTSKGHLTELALELRAAGETEAAELQATDSHLQACPECRAREAEWRRLFHTLASLPALEPSASFDDRVMARVRVPAMAKAPAPWLVRWVRPVVLGIAASWAVVVIGGGAWLNRQLDVPAGALVARLFSQVGDLALAALIRLGTFLHLSGLADTWSRFIETVPGQSVALAAALMAVVSGLAIWTLYRVISYQPPEAEAHA